MAEDRRMAALRKITDARSHPRDWTVKCPRAYAEYLKAHENLLRSLQPLPDLYFDQVIETAGISLAMAWSAGKDSERERAEDDDDF